MNPELQKAIADWLTALLSQAQQAGDFVIAQAPLVVQEKILFARITSVFDATLSVVVAVILLLVGRKLRATPGEGQYVDYNREDAGLWAYGGSVVCSILAVLFAHEAIFVWVAPRVYILQWLRSLV